MMEFFLSGSLPLIDFVICEVMSDMANKLLSLSLSLSPSLSLSLLRIGELSQKRPTLFVLIN